jgi:tetratricopeptide (TPR) repeat protein
MYNCPACGSEEVHNRATCLCGADLTPLQRLDGIADVWFNRALESLVAGHAGRALEWVSASCAARPTDAAARRVQAKIWAQLGHREEAHDALNRAAEIDANSPELEAIRDALQTAATAAQAESPISNQQPTVDPEVATARRRSAKRSAKQKTGRKRPR